MEWTTAKPTQPGWYWWRSPTYIRPKVVYVDDNGIITDCGMLNGLNARSYEHPIGGEWAGPIPEPIEGPRAGGGMI